MNNEIGRSVNSAPQGVPADNSAGG